MDKTMLEKELDKRFEELEKLEVGSDVWRSTIDGVSKLMDQKRELEKAELDSELKKSQAKDSKVDQRIRYGIDIAGIVLPIAVTIWGTVKSIKFEETGSITTIMGRGFINKLLPKK